MRKIISSFLAASLLAGSIGVAAAEPGAGVSSLDRASIASVTRQAQPASADQASARSAQDWTANQTIGK